MQKQTKHYPGWFVVLRKYILRNPRALIGIFIILFFAAVAIFAPQLATANPRSIEFFPWEKPSGEHTLRSFTERGSRSWWVSSRACSPV